MGTMGLRVKLILAALVTMAYIGTIFAANWALQKWGIVDVGLGMQATAGVYFAGLSLTLRDGVHELAGRRVVFAAILAGAICSYFVEDLQKIALASGVAFFVSELIDMAVYTPLRRKGWERAVAASAFVGSIVDTSLFLWLAFGSLDNIEGQLFGKWVATLVAVGVIATVRYKGRPSNHTLDSVAYAKGIK